MGVAGKLPAIGKAKVACLQRRIFLHNQDSQVTSIHGGPTWLSPQNWQGLHIVWSLTSPLGLHPHPAHLAPAQETSPVFQQIYELAA